MAYEGRFSPLEIAQHECTHAFSSHVIDRWPMWLTEGIADFFSTFETDGNAATIGIPKTLYVHGLRRVQLLPVTELFTAEMEPYKSVNAFLFYAEAWALTHYLLFKDEQSTRAFAQFDRLMQAGTAPLQAFREAFQPDLESLQNELKQYVNRVELPAKQIVFDQISYEGQMTVRMLPEAEVQCNFGILLAGLERPKEAGNYFKKAADAGFLFSATGCRSRPASTLAGRL